MLRIILILEVICLLELWAVMKILNQYGNITKEGMNSLTGNEGVVENIIEMKGISQSDIPTGCEAVSTVMVLQHLGIEITPE